MFRQAAPIINPSLLPRRVRATASDIDAQNPPIIDAYIKESAFYTMRLVNNIDELDQEILDSTLSYESGENNLQEKKVESTDALQLIRKRWPPTRSLFPPKSIQAGVNWTPLTSEFLSCSSIADWSRYKRYCKHRNRWGQFVRSNLDWDWSPAHCFKWIFDAKGNR